MAERTGLEPATPGVTGRYSNQLNYRSVIGLDRLTPRSTGLDPLAMQPNIIRIGRGPCQLSPISGPFFGFGGLVGAEGLEPPTFAV